MCIFTWTSACGRSWLTCCVGKATTSCVPEKSAKRERTLVTLDEHLGDWAVLPLSKHWGVIRVKAHPPTAKKVAAVLLPLLAGRGQAEFRNRLVIVSPGRARWIRTAKE